MISHIFQLDVCGDSAGHPPFAAAERSSAARAGSEFEHRAAPGPPPLRVQLRTGDTDLGPRARFVCDDAGLADPLRERTLALVRGAPAPVSSDTLRTTLGVRKQTLLALLHRLAAVLRRVGREAWRLASAVPSPASTSRNGNPTPD